MCHDLIGSTQVVDNIVQEGPADNTAGTQKENFFKKDTWTIKTLHEKFQGLSSLK